MKNIIITIVQINTIVGDISGNVSKIKKYLDSGNKNKSDLIVFPELSLTGYPPEDLILRKDFIDECENSIELLIKYSKFLKSAFLFGAPSRNKNHIHNSAIFINNGIKTYFNKINLPNHGVFDEKRVFEPGINYSCINLNGIRLGILICEDMWTKDVSEHLKKDGAEILISINASPYEKNKLDMRYNNAAMRVTENNIPLIYLNHVGGQDDLVFDGSSFVMDSKKRIVATLPSWQEKEQNLSFFYTDNTLQIRPSVINKRLDKFESIWSALVCGLKDYASKNSFSSVVLGLSGGIDSAVSAAIAVDALGSSNVHAIRMPSKYSSEGSLTDALESSKLLKIKLYTRHIDEVLNTLINNLSNNLLDKIENLTEENLQSRIRGIILMAFSNNNGSLLLTTGNKSEVAVGYSTIYGDMNGGYSVLKDVYKTEVYELAKWRNLAKELNFLGPKGIVIPKNSISKEPSAELGIGQKDSDSLPPYKKLDFILDLIIEKELSIKEIIKEGYEEDLVKKIYNLVRISEHKRNQSPPGVKISSKSFGKDRRYPITNKFFSNIKKSEK